MNDDDRPVSRGDAAGLLAGESLDSYSLDELDARVSLLEAEIARIISHRHKAAAHMLAAESLFRPKST